MRERDEKKEEEGENEGKGKKKEEGLIISYKAPPTFAAGTVL